MKEWEGTFWCSVVDLKIMPLKLGLRATGRFLEWLPITLSHCFSQRLELCQDLRTLYLGVLLSSKFTSQTELLFSHNQGNSRYHLGRIFGNFWIWFIFPICLFIFGIFKYCGRFFFVSNNDMYIYIFKRMWKNHCDCSMELTIRNAALIW